MPSARQRSSAAASAGLASVQDGGASAVGRATGETKKRAGAQRRAPRRAPVAPRPRAAAAPAAESAPRSRPRRRRAPDCADRPARRATRPARPAMRSWTSGAARRAAPARRRRRGARIAAAPAGCRQPIALLRSTISANPCWRAWATIAATDGLCSVAPRTRQSRAAAGQGAGDLFGSRGRRRAIAHRAAQLAPSAGVQHGGALRRARRRSSAGDARLTARRPAAARERSPPARRAPSPPNRPLPGRRRAPLAPAAISARNGVISASP